LLVPVAGTCKFPSPLGCTYVDVPPPKIFHPVEYEPEYVSLALLYRINPGLNDVWTHDPFLYVYKSFVIQPFAVAMERYESLSAGFSGKPLVGSNVPLTS
jgi:hypothetical protein